MKQTTRRLVAGALVLCVAMAGVTRADEAKKEHKINQETTYTGIVAVIKDGATVKDITLTIDKDTIDHVKLNENGLKLKDFDGKKVKVLGVMRKTDNGPLLTVRECSEVKAEAAEKRK